MLAEQLQADLTTAMKARDAVTVSVLRMAIAAVKEAAVAGDSARELSDDDVVAVLTREAKRREEAAAAFTDGGRPERATAELAERDILARYLPAPLTDDELAALVDGVLSEGGFDSPRDMGPAMKAVNARVAGRADGKTVATLVKARLAGC
ncbi:MAG TPA: GatB/YqeY domain-containing protein [Acidimicrobiales bacterium]|nr:GatB/YqeY domain-containing protein [Acidimicrobiales bacterium]